MQKVYSLVKAIPYIQKFKGKVFVIKIGGEIIEDKSRLNLVTKDIALLQEVGIKVIVVHGGAKQASKLSEQLGFKPKIVNGRRITDEKALEVVKMVYGGKLSLEILSLLSKHGLKPVGLSGIDGNIIQARKRDKVKIQNSGNGATEEIDFGFVGDIVAVNSKLLEVLLENDFIPVISSIASDKNGVIFNMNAESVAAEIAKELKAEKFIVISNVPGVLKNAEDKNSLISYLTIKEINELIEKGVITKGMHPKILACIAAVNGGVKRTHILDGTKKHSLLFEVFTEGGTGTMIVTEKEKQDYLKKEVKAND